MDDNELPSLPQIPQWSVLRHWMLCLLWTCLGGLGPAFMLIIDSLVRWQGYDNPIDWPQVWHLAIGGAVMAGGAYWRKYRALLRQPPVGAPPAGAGRNP